jgi:uncharacterized protein DUF4386
MFLPPASDRGHVAAASAGRVGRFVMEDTRRNGAFAAFALAAAPVAFFIAILAFSASGVPQTNNPAGQLASAIQNPVLFGGFAAASVILGASLIVLALALHERLRGAAPFAVRVGTTAGVIGGALFVTNGMGQLLGVGQLATLDAQNHEAAVAAFAALTLVGGMLFSTGSVMFGAFALIDNVVGARARLLPRPLSYVGTLLGIALILGVAVPGPLGLVFPVLILVWSLWLGVALLRSAPRGAPAPGAMPQARA